MSTLKPCPNPECACDCPVPGRTDTKEAFWIECFECGLSGPVCKTLEQAFRILNAIPRQVPEVVVEALKFYGAGSNHGSRNSGGEWIQSAIREDGGRLAQRALASLEPKKKPE